MSASQPTDSGSLVPVPASLFGVMGSDGSLIRFLKPGRSNVVDAGLSSSGRGCRLFVFRLVGRRTLIFGPPGVVVGCLVNPETTACARSWTKEHDLGGVCLSDRVFGRPS